MARLKNAEWATMIIQRALEIDPKKRRKFISTLEELGILDPTNKDQGIIKKIINNCLPRLEKPNADLRMLGKAKCGLAKINDRENVLEKHQWNFISQYQPGDSPDAMRTLLLPAYKYLQKKVRQEKRLGRL